MAAQYRVDIGTYDGQGGNVRARAFVRDVETARLSSGMADANVAGIVRAAMRGDARIWIDTQDLIGTAGLGLWTTLRPLLLDAFAVTPTVNDLAEMEKTLEHKASESVLIFYTRCQRYHLEADADIPAEEQDTDAYRNQFGRKVKFSFMKGLREDIRLAMTSIDVPGSTGAQLLTAAKNAESILAKKTGGAGGTSKGRAEVDAMTANLSEDGKAVLASMGYQQRGGGRGGGRGRGYGRGGREGRGGGRPPAAQDGGGPGGGRRQGSVPLDVLQGRQRAHCTHCNKMVKHRANECFDNPNNASAGNPPRYTDGGAAPPRGGGRGGGRGRSYAAAAAGDPGQEFETFDFNDGASGN